MFQIHNFKTMFDKLNQQPQVQPTLVPMVPATTIAPAQGGDINYVKKLIEYALRKFSQKAGKSTAPLSSPLTTKPMGPVEAGGATRAGNKTISDFTNF